MSTSRQWRRTETGPWIPSRSCRTRFQSSFFWFSSHCLISSQVLKKSIPTCADTATFLLLNQFYLCMTRFQLILPVDYQNVTKNGTGHRMHVAGPQIYQINRQTNSFQNMCDMLQVTIDHLARKIYFVQKKHLKISSFGVHESGLPDFGRTWTQNC